jgi:SAM-dependent methyltransferase
MIGAMEGEVDPAADRQHRLRATFDGVAAEYDVRPPYPPEMYDRITADCGVGPGCQVVEIGPGTGLATIPLLDRGCRVTGIELGPQMAARLAERAAGRDLEVVVSTFEDAPLDDASGDVVLSATAFHWVDASVGVPKAYRVLRPHGWLVLVWNVFGDPERDDPFEAALTEMLQRVEPDLAAPRTPIQSLPDARSWADTVDGHALFEPARPETYRWSGTHTTAELCALFSTFSSWIDRGPDRLAVLLAELARLADEQFGGVVTRPYQTALVTARKPG